MPFESSLTPLYYRHNRILCLTGILNAGTQVLTGGHHGCEFPSSSHSIVLSGFTFKWKLEATRVRILERQQQRIKGSTGSFRVRGPSECVVSAVACAAGSFRVCGLRSSLCLRCPRQCFALILVTAHNYSPVLPTLDTVSL